MGKAESLYKRDKMQKYTYCGNESILKRDLKFFFISNVWVFLVGFAWYSLLRRNLGGLDLIQSSVILCIFHLFTSVITVISEWRKSKDVYDSIFNTVFSLGIYTVITYYVFKGIIIIIVLCIAVVIFTVRIALLVRQSCNVQDKRITKKRIITSYKRVMFVALSIIIIICGYTRLFGPALMYSSAKATVNTYQQYEDALKSNISTIRKLNADEWNALNTSERLDVLQCICNLESIMLGISNCSLKVGVGDADKGELGYYDYQRELIIIDSEHLFQSDSWDVCNTVCHETYHCFQQRLAELYVNTDSRYQGLCIFNHVAKYTQEINDYVDGKDDFAEYYKQDLETNAREFALQQTYILKDIAETGYIPKVS